MCGQQLQRPQHHGCCFPCVLIKLQGGAGYHAHFTDGEWRFRDRNNFSSSQIGLSLNHAKYSAGPHAGLTSPLPRWWPQY